MYHYLESRTQFAFPLYGKHCAVHLSRTLREGTGAAVLQPAAMIDVLCLLTQASIHKKPRQNQCIPFIKNKIYDKIHNKTSMVGDLDGFICWANKTLFSLKIKMKIKMGWLLKFLQLAQVKESKLKREQWYCKHAVLQNYCDCSHGWTGVYPLHSSSSLAKYV